MKAEKLGLGAEKVAGMTHHHAAALL